MDRKLLLVLAFAAIIAITQLLVTSGFLSNFHSSASSSSFSSSSSSSFSSFSSSDRQSESSPQDSQDHEKEESPRHHQKGHHHLEAHEEVIRSSSSSSSSSPTNCKYFPLHANASKVNVVEVRLCRKLRRRRRRRGGGENNKKKEEVDSIIIVKLDSKSVDECRRNSNDVGPPKLTSNSKLRSQWLQAGPHAFRLRLEGVEHVMIVPQEPVFDRQRCEYTFILPSKKKSARSIEKSNKKGEEKEQEEEERFRIGFEMLYRNYAHIDESRDVWPELLKQPLLRIQSDFSTKYHLQQCTLPSQEFYYVVPNDNDSEEEEDEKNNHDHHRRPCDGTELDTSGTWRRTHSGKLVWTRVRVRKIRKEPILFEWALQSEPEARWYPNSCSLHQEESKKEEEAEELSRIFSKYNGKRIVISGDSQLRALYYSVVNTLNGNGDRCVRNITTQLSEPRECIPNVKGSQRKSISFSHHQQQQQQQEQEEQQMKIQVDYIDDLFLNRIKYKLKNYDVVIAGFAQHPASKEHWRFDRYAAAVQQRMNELRKVSSSSSSKSKVVWVAAPHYPHTTKGYPVAVRDWRTDARLQLFNNCSVEAARASGFAILDEFSISDPFAHTSPDQAHFSNFVAGEFVRMLWSILLH